MITAKDLTILEHLVKINKIPTLQILADRFGISRERTRQIMEKLEGQGYVEKINKKYKLLIKRSDRI